MTELELKTWLYRYSCRTEALLTNPKGFEQADFILPKNVALHYMPMSANDLGPEDKWFMLRNSKRQRYVHHVGELATMEGSPRLIAAVNVVNLGKLYNRTHENVKRVSKLPLALMDKKHPMVFNYSMLTPRYRYQRNMWSRLHRFNNQWSTLCNTVQKIANESTRAHLICFNLPEVLPARNRFASVEEFNDEVLDTAFNKVDTNVILKGDVNSIRNSMNFQQFYIPYTQQLNSKPDNDIIDDLTRSMDSFDEMSLGWSDDATIELEGCDCDLGFEAWSKMTLGWFPDDDSMQLVDLWRWLSDKREDSMLNVIAPENYGKVNFVFTCGGRYTVVNMGMMDTIRDKTSEKASTQRFHKFLNALMAFRQIDQKDVVLATIPEDTYEKPTVLGMVPAGSEDASILEPVPESDNNDEYKSEVLGAVEQQFAGKRQMMIDADVTDIGELDSADITEVEQEDLAALPEVKSEQIVSRPVPEEVMTVDTSNPLEAGVVKKSAELLRRGIISQAEHKRHIKLSRKYKEIKVGDQTLEQLATIPEEKIWNFKAAEIPDMPFVTDKGMLESSLINFDTQYVEEVMEHDTAAMVLHIQRAGVNIVGFEKENYTDVLSKTIDYRVKVSPVNGKESTLSFQLPRINRNSKYTVGGVNYYMRKLRMDKPIRKINSSTVCLTTYYGKIFIDRSKKRANSYSNWLISAITRDILGADSRITGAVYGSSYGENQPVPRIYSSLAETYLEFTLEGIKFIWDYPNIEKNFPGIDKKLISKDMLPVGLKGNIPVWMNGVGKLFINEKYIGDLPTLIGLDPSTAPPEIAVLRYMGKEIPMGIVLSYLLGINKLAEVLYNDKVSLEADEIKPEYPRRRIKGAKRDTQPDEFEVIFGDEIWVFPNDGSKASLIFASLNAWKKHLRTVQVAELNDKQHFLPMFINEGLSTRNLTELDLFDELFLDPIAMENLRYMKEPDELKALFIRACEMLVTDTFKSDQDTSLILARGYERMNGAVYKAIVDSIRVYRNRPVSSKSSIDLNPYEVLTSIQKDPSVSLVEDSNVIHNLKEKESMTYSGTGGRSKLAMTRRTRTFHKTDLGVRSEAGVDSGDVGINVYMPPNPNYTSLRGSVQTVPVEGTSPSKLISTSMLTAPFAEYDDTKRVGFITVQNDHYVAINGGDVMPIHTGYDSVLAHRTDDLFSFTAKLPGKVVEITDKAMVIEYKDGKRDSVRIGRRFGVVTGHTVPHKVITDLKVGDSFPMGKVLAWNKGFYKRDIRDPNQVCLISGTIVYCALLEKNETWEDSSLISPELASRMISKVSHVRTLFVKFTDSVHNLVTSGDDVDIESILAVIEDKTISTVGGDNLEALNMLSRPSPRSGYQGKVEELQVIYFGDKEDMSPSVRKIADKYDRERAALVKQLGSDDAKTGEITTPARVDGISVDIDMMAIRIFITEERTMSGGDKLVLSNQLKSVIAGEQKGPTWTATELWPGGGTRKIELEFSYRAQEARIVHSSIMAGMSIICQEFISVKTVEAYDS